ncbi:RICIN domain-containing protein [Nocardia beijingensis]|nr:RICIN domain-containing protein [Nocardia beijingensis]
MRLDYLGGPGPVYRIMIEHSGMCLTVENASKTQGSRFVQWPYNGTGNQHWRAESVRDGYIKLVASHSGMCLDVLGISADNGAQLIQWPYWGGANQMWRL